MKIKPSIPKGTRDFLPHEVQKRNYIIETIKEVFELHGYAPIETPAMEKLETLTGKYGEEGDKLLFKVLNSGNFLSGVSAELLNEKHVRKLAFQISGKGLRYDLTVPFARFVVQYQNDISFPFKRYQIQPVWRADRPQRGRYREFWQCDVDVIGSAALLNDAEMVRIYDTAFTKLNLQVSIRLNNRKILQGLCEALGVSEHFTAITVAIDKLEKAGKEKVKEEMKSAGISEEQAAQIFNFLELKGANQEKLENIRVLLKGSATGLEGVNEMNEVIQLLEQSGENTQQVVFDQGLARGLDYYTGTIYEIVSSEMQFGSLGGGGRYDNLTEIFGMSGMSGVGISFGLDRIYDVLFELNRFPENQTTGSRLLFINFDEQCQQAVLGCLPKIRKSGICVELYPDHAKMKKQMKYANDKQIPFVALVGSREIEEGKITLKNMESGEQLKLSLEEMIETVEK